jgi:uncharacterized protein YuzE
VYNQVARTNQTLRDIALAKSVMSSRDNVLNFVRMNQGDWPENAQIKMDENDLSVIAPDAVAGFIDQYNVVGANITDVYLAYRIDESVLHANQIARHIGGDAAVVNDDGIAYGNTWAVAAPDFMVGDLIYRISSDVSDKDTSKYLHRATSGEDDFNVMQRDLNMARHNIHNVATLSSGLLAAKNANTNFLNSDDISAQNVYFSSGANMDGENVWFKNLRVSGDMYGFRNIVADTLNGASFTTSGHVIADKVEVMNSIKVGNNLTLKSDSSRSISGFTMINASSVLTPFVSTEEIIFYENFGLTISGELLMSTTPPLKIGNWIFPSAKPPQFTNFSVDRANIPQMPNNADFQKITNSDWRTDNNYKETTQQ